ncbi:MAG: hypothetical protein ACR2JP_11740 [Acidimicrobiia bacterium]
MKRITGLVAMLLLVGACSANPAAETATSAPTGSTGTNSTSGSTDEGTATTTGGPTPMAESCAPLTDGTPWTDEVSAEAVTIQEPGRDTVGVQAVVYPHPDYEGRPWSQWGQGFALPDGRFLSAIGDHGGADANSYLYEFDPATGLLTQIADALSLIDHAPGDWGYGKIHAQMVAGPCGDVFTSTYWGSRRGLAYQGSYTGDYLLRIDPETRTIAAPQVLAEERGSASMASWPQGGLVYAEAADPFGRKTGDFVVVDAITGETVFSDDSAEHLGYRSIAVDADGGAWITWNGTSLARYDPESNSLEPTDVTLPGTTLRAVTRPAADGTIYAVTDEPPIFFALEPDGAVRQLGEARKYTTSLALSADETRFFSVPGAHSGLPEEGTPLVAIDTETGAEEVILELHPLVEEALGLALGGTYNVVASGENTLYIGINAGPLGSDEGFGEIILLIVTLP